MKFVKETFKQFDSEHQLFVELSYLEQFTHPVSLVEEQRLLEQFRQEVSLSDKYHLALVIGRFQPLHRGHLHLIKQALTLSETIVIGIGSANVTNSDNPFSAGARKILLERALYREGIRDKVSKIVPLNDYANDTFWLHETIRRTGNVDAVFGNNDWVNGIFENAGYTAVPIPLLQRGVYEGKKVREKMREDGKLPLVA